MISQFGQGLLSLLLISTLVRFGEEELDLEKEEASTPYYLRESCHRAEERQFVTPQS